MSDAVTTAADDLVEAEAMVRQIIADHPDLTDCGIGLFRERRLTDAERVNQFTRCRDRMLDPRSIRQFCAARAWLQQFPKIPTSITPKHPTA